jgi:hypothetical protein
LGASPLGVAPVRCSATATPGIMLFGRHIIPARNHPGAQSSWRAIILARMSSLAQHVGGVP